MRGYDGARLTGGPNCLMKMFVIDENGLLPHEIEETGWSNQLMLKDYDKC